MVVVVMTALHDPHKLLDEQERDDACKDPHAHAQVVRVAVPVVPVTVAVVVVRVVVAVSALLEYRVRYEVEKRVPEQAARGEAQQDFEERRVGVGAVERDEEEYQERGDGDQCGRHDGLGQQPRPVRAFHGRNGLRAAAVCAVVVAVVVRVVVSS